MIIRKEEIRRVKELGKLIGYGNMMDIASALWQADLHKNYTLDTGAHIPVSLPMIKEKYIKKCTERQKAVMRECGTL